MVPLFEVFLFMCFWHINALGEYTTAKESAFFAADADVTMVDNLFESTPAL